MLEFKQNIIMLCIQGASWNESLGFSRYDQVHHETKVCCLISAQDLDPLDPEDFGFLDPDPQKYANTLIRIEDVKYQQKLQ